MTFALFRILGNDLPPRHRAGQTRTNLKFILEHEPDLPSCRKSWVLNRIADPAERDRLTALLVEHGQSSIEIPFAIEEYRRCRSDRIDDENVFEQPPPPEERERHNKILYAINVNGARNAALRAGRGMAEWILPLDGNCCFTAEGWQELTKKLAGAPSRRGCYAVPMYRLLSNDDYRVFSRDGKIEAESQVVLGRDCPLEFNEHYRYGYKDKLQLLRGLGYAWVEDGFGTVITDERYRCGYVLRLFSGVGDGESGVDERILLRERGIDALLSRLD